MNTGHLESFTGLVQLIIIIINTTTITTPVTDTQHYIGPVEINTRWIVCLNIFSDCKRYLVQYSMGGVWSVWPSW